MFTLKELIIIVGTIFTLYGTVFLVLFITGCAPLSTGQDQFRFHDDLGFGTREYGTPERY